MRRVNIAFTGTHSTGKTTLLDAFVSSQPERTILTIREISRAVIARGFPMGKATVVDSWVNFVRDQLRAERKFYAAAGDVLVSDRTVLDAVAYARVNKRLPRPYIPEYFIEMLEEIWLREEAFYDLYVYFPVEFPMVQDGARDDDEDYRNAVSEEIIALLYEHAVDAVSIRGSVEERIEQLVDAVESVKRTRRA